MTRTIRGVVYEVVFDGRQSLLSDYRRGSTLSGAIMLRPSVSWGECKQIRSGAPSNEATQLPMGPAATTRPAERPGRRWKRSW